MWRKKRWCAPQKERHSRWRRGLRPPPAAAASFSSSSSAAYKNSRRSWHHMMAASPYCRVTDASSASSRTSNSAPVRSGHDRGFNHSLESLKFLGESDMAFEGWRIGGLWELGVGFGVSG